MGHPRSQRIRKNHAAQSPGGRAHAFVGIGHARRPRDRRPVVARRRPPHRRELDRLAGDGRDLEDRPCLGSEPGDPLAGELAQRKEVAA